MSLLPQSRMNFGYFDRQMDLFPDWVDLFNDDWRMANYTDSRARFGRLLGKVRREMERMDVQPVNMDLRHPFITDLEGNHKFTLRFDCSQFKPNEISLKTQDGRLQVHAKHVHEEEDRKVLQEFYRECVLPENVDPESLKSCLSEDGVLQIEAPVPSTVIAPKEHLIPIEHLIRDIRKRRQVVPYKGENETTDGLIEEGEDGQNPK